MLGSGRIAGIAGVLALCNGQVNGDGPHFPARYAKQRKMGYVPIFQAGQSIAAPRTPLESPCMARTIGVVGFLQ